MSDTISTSLGNGITLDLTGSYQSPLTIEATGTIDAATGTGVYSTLTGAMLYNYGTVIAGTYGVSFQGGGAVTNSGTAASIYGQSNAVVIRSTPATLINDGTIASNGSEALYVQGGTITNAAGATISSQYADGIVGVYGFATTLINTGVIISENTAASNSAGISLQNDVYVTNNAGGTIAGVAGVQIDNTGTVFNAGTIIGNTTYGSDFFYEIGLTLGNGYISNSASGVIDGTYLGVALNNGSLYNAGTISGSTALRLGGQATVTNAAGGDIAGAIGGLGTLSFFNAGTAGGILIHYGYAYVSNASTGTIYGIADQSYTSVNIINDGLIEAGQGVSLQGGGTVTNAGTIYEPGGTAVYLGGTGTNELIVEPGGEMYGAVVGGPSSTNILSLAAGSSGTIDGLSGFQTVDIAAGALWSLVGNQAGLASGETINGFDVGDEVTVTDFAATAATYVAGLGLELISAASTVTVDLTGNLLNGALLVTNNGAASYIGYETNSLSSSINTGITLVGVGNYSTRFTVAPSGTIDTPDFVGVYSAASPATLYNEGAISAADFGVVLAGGGYISNGAAATIYGLSNGVAIDSASATLLNDGTIRTDAPSRIGYLTGDAVYIAGNGTITNAAGATIISENGTGIEGNPNGGPGSAITLTNYGLIVAQADQSGRFVGVSLQGDGYVTNAYGATIAGAVGLQINGYGSVLNQGTIIGSVSSTAYLYLQNGLVLGTGTISNSASGLIEGAENGLYITGSGTVTNAGSIVGTAKAAIELQADGTVINQATGTIDSSGSYGVAGATISVVNDGLIIGSIGVDLASGYVSNNADGTIESYNNDVLATGAGATVINAGTVELTGSAGSGIDLLQSGEVTNSASGLITTNDDGFGIQGYQTSIVNMGTITQSRIGVAMYAGYLSNSSGGYIFGSLYGVYANGSGDTVINVGTIEGDPNASSNGIEEAQGGTVDNAGSGYIFGNLNGVYGRGAAIYVANAGTITGRDNGINEVEGGSLFNSLGGTIYGGNQGVLLHRFGSIENLGLIQSTATNGYGIYLDQGGTVLNAASGVIGAAGLGGGIKDYYTGPTSITNDGTINNAIDGVVLFSGYVTNGAAATIDASSDGIIVFGGASTIANAGTIKGTNLYGILSEDTATLTVYNSATGTIASSLGDGIKLKSPGSVNNAGLITGQSHGIVDYTAYISNSLTGTIKSQYTGIDFVQGGTVNNDGNITGGVDGGIVLGPNGEVINGTAGYISAYSGPGIAGQTGTVLNYGTIAHSYHGIDLATGSISNGANGLISGAGIGIQVTNSQSTIVNAGQIGSYNYGISEVDGGSIYNRVTGRISGGTAGVVVKSQSSADTIVNAGTISGSFGAYAIYFQNMAGNTLIADPGAVFTGMVGGQNPGNLLALAAGGRGTLDTDSFSGFSTIDVETGADWTLTGTDGDLANNINGTAATVSLAADSTLDVTGNIDADQTIVFAGDHATLGIDVNASIAGTIDLETVGGDFQTIDIASLAIGSITLQSFDSATNVLTLGYVGDPPETLNFNSGEAENYTLQDDGAGGTDIVIPCFVTDTRILTTKGYFPVQNLCVGDRVVTVRAGGPASAEIVWLGQRTVDCESVEAPEAAWPILFRAGALGPAMPVRDLWVSPEHCLMLDGVLIAAKLLVNGQSIRQVPRPRVTYWHVELTAHDVLLAEGVPAESYLDTGNRAAFSEGDAPARSARVHHWTDTCLPMAFGQKALAHYEAHMARFAEMLEVS